MYPHKWEIGIFNAEWGRKVIREKIKWTYEFTVVFFIACYQMGAAQNKYEIKKKKSDQNHKHQRPVTTPFEN